jgi:ubiquinone/menaquinone biosynthesis C-methylase UbiE
MHQLNLQKLRCPVCFNTVLSKNASCLICEKCKSNFIIHDGIIDFLTGDEKDTLLDLESYDENHGVNENKSKGIYDIYFHNVSEHMETAYDEMLEIGSGTGNLTFGLCKYSPFKKIHCSDVSLRFLNRLQNRVEKVNLEKKVIYYRFDANNLPFNNESMDLILGHSILHHLVNFEKTLEDSYNILKRGGVAMFGEPIMATHAFISLAASLILETDAVMPSSRLNDKEKLVLEKTATKAANKERHLRGERDKLVKIEDKFIFPIEYIRDLSEKIGYQLFKVIQWAPVTDLGSLIKEHLSKILSQNKCNYRIIDDFQYIFNSIQNTYGASEREYLSQPFGFFLFKK